MPNRMQLKSRSKVKADKLRRKMTTVFFFVPLLCTVCALSETEFQNNINNTAPLCIGSLNPFLIDSAPVCLASLKDFEIYKFVQNAVKNVSGVYVVFAETFAMEHLTMKHTKGDSYGNSLFFNMGKDHISKWDHVLDYRWKWDTEFTSYFYTCIPMAEEVYFVLKSIMEPNKSNTFTIQNQFDERMSDKDKDTYRPHTYVHLEDPPDSTLENILQSHDETINYLSFRLKETLYSTRNLNTEHGAIIFYTGKMNARFYNDLDPAEDLLVHEYEDEDSDEEINEEGKREIPTTPTTTLTSTTSTLKENLIGEQNILQEQNVVIPQQITQPPSIKTLGFSTNNVLFILTGMEVRSQDGKARAIRSLPDSVKEETRHITSQNNTNKEPSTISTSLQFAVFLLKFEFIVYYEESNKYWHLVNVTIIEANEEVGYTKTWAKAPHNNSYKCHEPIVVFNKRDSSAVIIPYYKIQPIIGRLDDFNTPLIFGPAIDCTPLFTIPIISGLLVTGLFFSILISGLVMLSNIGGPVRFDSVDAELLYQDSGVM